MTRGIIWVHSYLLSGDVAKAREQAEAILAKDEKNSYGHMLMSNIHLKEKNLDAAIAEAGKAAEGEKKTEAYMHLANLYIIKRDLNAAEEVLRAAVKLDEKELKPRFALAEFYLRSGRTELAEQEYVQATMNAPQNRRNIHQAGKFLCICP